MKLHLNIWLRNMILRIANKTTLWSHQANYANPALWKAPLERQRALIKHTNTQLWWIRSNQKQSEVRTTTCESRLEDVLSLTFMEEQMVAFITLQPQIGFIIKKDLRICFNELIQCLVKSPRWCLEIDKSGHNLKILVYNYTKLRKAAKDEIFGTTRHYFMLSVSSLILGVQVGRSQEETKQTRLDCGSGSFTQLCDVQSSKHLQDALANRNVPHLCYACCQHLWQLHSSIQTNTTVNLHSQVFVCIPTMLNRCGRL